MINEKIKKRVKMIQSLYCGDFSVDVHMWFEINTVQLC